MGERILAWFQKALGPLFNLESLQNWSGNLINLLAFQTNLSRQSNQIGTSKLDLEIQSIWKNGTYANSQTNQTESTNKVIYGFCNKAAF